MQNDNQNIEPVHHCFEYESLDQLINDMTIREYELKSAMLVEDDELIEKLDREISGLLNALLGYQCSNSAERKMLLGHLFDRYLSDGEIRSFIPSGVLDKMRSLF